MTRAFMWFLLVLAVFMLGLGLTGSAAPKPFVILLWVVVAAFAAYRLFGARKP